MCIQFLALLCATVVTRLSVVFSVFVNMGPYGRKKKLQTTSPLKVPNRFTPQNPCILPGRVSNKAV